MKDDFFETLETKYTNWDFASNMDGRDIILIKSIEQSSIEETLEIINEIYTFSHDNKWEIKIENKDGFTIHVIESKESPKYDRMYTSGCFDIFHYGHLNILEKSKELCDYLIVGVSTDELIKKEKGKYPIIPFEERLKVVKAIGYVDQVIPQVDKNKQRVVDEYNIDAISVGDDWKGRFPPTSCPIEYFPYTANVSSTILKDTLQLQKNKI